MAQTFSFLELDCRIYNCSTIQGISGLVHGWLAALLPYIR